MTPTPLLTLIHALHIVHALRAVGLGEALLRQPVGVGLTALALLLAGIAYRFLTLATAGRLPVLWGVNGRFRYMLNEGRDLRGLLLGVDLEKDDVLEPLSLFLARVD